jgi:hypothetical protein
MDTTTFHPIQPPPPWGVPAQLEAAGSTQDGAGSSLAPNIPAIPGIPLSFMLDDLFCSAGPSTAASSYLPPPSQPNLGVVSQPVPSTLTTAGTINARPNPQYSSHMPNIFTTQYACE